MAKPGINERVKSDCAKGDRTRLKFNVLTRPSQLRRLHFLDHLAQFFQRDILDLADAFAGDAEFLADFFQRFFRAAVEAEAGAQDGRFARIEGLDHFLEHAGDGLFFELLVGRVGASS